MSKTTTTLEEWVAKTAQLTLPDKIHWCTGSKDEYDSLICLMLEKKEMSPFNSETHPNCYLYRSNPNDVARTEHLTYVCTVDKDSAGPNNNWIHPKDAHEKADRLFAGCMRNRTMYVVPYCMGPLNSPYARFGVEITDSPYVVVNMHLMTRMGKDAQMMIESGHSFVKGLHSVGELSLESRGIFHFPEEGMIKSFGSGYGGNALLGKKCHALRLASWQAKHEGWLAEHMLILGLENPAGEKHYIAAAFPSACGKTNLAMLIPPDSYKGWKIWTVGDDIAWIHKGDDGRLYAINPEAGFFGVAPGTSQKTNPNAIAMLENDSIFTNVAVTADNQPWWEGKNSQVPVTDWLGESYASKKTKAAHPNSRFTVSIRRCPSLSSEWENPKGVPLSAIVFGGRRSSLIPLVYEAKSWEHGVLMGASMCSQTTAAATGKVGVLRHDPMAMKPFCGYHFGDYWNHWLSMDDGKSRLPKIFHVNWFRKNEKNDFLWPGFGENIRVLEWIIKRSEGQGEAVLTPVGKIPTTSAINSKELDIDEQTLKTLTQITPYGWLEEVDRIEKYLQSFGDRVPKKLWEELENVKFSLKN